MEHNVYGKRMQNEHINLNNVVMGISSKDNLESWAILECIDNNVFADLESLSVYKTEMKDSRVLKVKESRVNKMVMTRTRVRELDSIFGVAKLGEVFKQFKEFFDNAKNLSYNDELVRIREICNLYQPLFESLDNGEDVYLTSYELNCMMETFKRMYTYAFGSPMNQETKIEVSDKKLRNPNEAVDLEKTCIANAKRKNSTGNINIILELVGPYIHDDNLLVYRNTETEEYYYVNAKGEAVIPEERPFIEASTDIESFSEFRGVSDCLKAAYRNPDEFNEADTKAMELFASMEFNLAQVREINQNKKFLFRSYDLLNKTASPKTDYKPSIVEDFKELNGLLTTLEVFTPSKTKRL